MQMETSRGPSNEHSYQVWLQLAQWFQRRRVKFDTTLFYTFVPLVSFVTFRLTKKKHFLEDHPVNILTKSSSNRPNCFKRRRLKWKIVQTMTDPKWSHYSLNPELKRWGSHACFRTTLYAIWNNLVLIPILQRAEFNFQIWNKIDKDNLEYRKLYQKVYILYIVNFDFSAISLLSVAQDKNKY
jgi:hypothetical protein